MKHSIFQNLLEIIKTRQFISCLFGWWLKYYVFFLCYCYNVIKHKDVKGIFSFAEFSAAIAKHVFLPLKILIFWFQIVAFRIFNQKLNNSYPCLEQSWHCSGDRLTFSVHTIRRPGKLGEIWNRKNSHAPVIWICVGGNLGEGSVTSLFSKCFPFTPKRKVGARKFLGF